MEAITDSLARSMQSEIDSLQLLLEKSQSGAWVDYAIIGGFALIALLLVGKFADSGPKKLFGYLGVLIGSAFALRWLTKRRMRGVHDAYLQIKEGLNERQKLIEAKERTISDLRARMAGLRPEIAEDREALANLDREIRESEKNMEHAIADAETKSMLARVKAERALSKMPAALSAERMLPLEVLSPLGEDLSRLSVADPTPHIDIPGNIIEINGFTLKGDIK